MAPDSIPNVLIVDDIALSLRTMLEMLIGLNAVMMTASSEDEALSLCQEHEFALILVDLEMPDEGGIELLSQLRERAATRYVPVIFVTVQSQYSSFLTRAYKAGAADFLYKPVSRLVVRSKAQMFLELYSQRRGLRALEALKKSQRDLEREVEERRCIEEELVDLNATLELRVAERTAQLSVANRTLKAEIRERRQALVVLRTARERAEAASEAKSNFLAGMSHELRTPLNSIIGFSEILEGQHFGPLNAKQVRHVGNIHNSGKHLLGLINDILDLSKIEAGRMEMRSEPIFLSDAIDAVRPDIATLAEKSGLTFSVEVEPDLPAIKGDIVRVKQILYNLLSNAVKFTPASGSVRLRAGRARNPIGHPGTQEVEVSDTGIGISPGDIQKIFNPFMQAHEGSTRAFKGTGLGLSLTKHLVEAHLGKIEMKSEGEGKGCCVLVRLPEATGPRQTSAAESVTKDTAALTFRPSPMESTPDSKSSLVLVIDADSAACEILARQITEIGHTAVIAQSLDQGLHLAREVSPRLIIVDPESAAVGWDLLTFLGEDEQTREIPAVVHSIVDEMSMEMSNGQRLWSIKPSGTWITKPASQEQIRDLIIGRLGAAPVQRDEKL